LAALPLLLTLGVMEWQLSTFKARSGNYVPAQQHRALQARTAAFRRSFAIYVLACVAASFGVALITRIGDGSPPSVAGGPGHARRGLLPRPRHRVARASRTAALPCWLLGAGADSLRRMGRASSIDAGVLVWRSARRDGRRDRCPPASRSSGRSFDDQPLISPLSKGLHAVTTVAVTGAEGFIGSHLVGALVSEGYAVRAMVQYNSFSSWGWLETLDVEVLANVEVVLGDVRDHGSVMDFTTGVDAICHLAALIAIPYSYRAPESYLATNAGGTLNILEAARSHETPLLIHTSTSEVYGTAQSVPIDETHRLQAQSPYAV
jgi:hypothetical protein